jgi:hypothetical protein
MVIGDYMMKFNPTSYKLTRSDILSLFKKYDAMTSLGDVDKWAINQCKSELLSLHYNELLILQSSLEHWNKLMSDHDLNFRRFILAKVYNLTRSHIVDELSITDGAVSNLFNNATLPKWPRPYQLSILMNHPWQLVNKVNPDPLSYRESPEYFQGDVSKQISVMKLRDERSNVKSICGYVITDPASLFLNEYEPITGRWVTTYQEYDYFEFHVTKEPIVDRPLQSEIQKLFPQAEYIYTTFLPYKPLKRAVWIIIPKNKNLGSYYGMLHEFKRYRKETVFHSLRQDDDPF